MKKRPYPDASENSSDESSDESNDGSSNKDEWAEWNNILFLKQLGFSMDEIRGMTMQEFIVYTDLAAGDPSEREEASMASEPRERVRKATQEDIDRFFGGF